jgi:hypothetical protein
MSLEKRAAAGAEAAAATLSSVQTMLTAVANRKRRLNSAQSPIMDKTAVRERERARERERGASLLPVCLRNQNCIP